jgi:phosphatidylglycerophosphatase GEP4
VTVLRHAYRKPGCDNEIMAYLRSQEETKDVRPDQIAIVGDRLMTDMMLANRMGAWGVWVKNGVVRQDEKSVVSSDPSMKPTDMAIPSGRDLSRDSQNFVK